MMTRQSRTAPAAAVLELARERRLRELDARMAAALAGTDPARAAAWMAGELAEAEGKTMVGRPGRPVGSERTNKEERILVRFPAGTREQIRQAREALARLHPAFAINDADTIRDAMLRGLRSIVAEDAASNGGQR